MKLLAIAVMIGIMAVSLPVFAEEHNNVPDQLGSIFDGSGNTYIGAELIKDIDMKAPLGIDKIGLKLWADVLAGKIDDGVKRDVRGGARVRLIF